MCVASHTIHPRMFQGVSLPTKRKCCTYRDSHTIHHPLNPSRLLLLVIISGGLAVQDSRRSPWWEYSSLSSAAGTLRWCSHEHIYIQPCACLVSIQKGCKRWYRLVVCEWHSNKREQYIGFLPQPPPHTHTDKQACHTKLFQVFVHGDVRWRWWHISVTKLVPTTWCKLRSKYQGGIQIPMKKKKEKKIWTSFWNL